MPRGGVHQTRRCPLGVETNGTARIAGACSVEGASGRTGCKGLPFPYAPGTHRRIDPVMTVTKALQDPIRRQAAPRPEMPLRRVAPAAARTATLPLGVSGLALSLALHTGALLGGISLLDARNAGTEPRALSLRFEESQASVAALPAPEPAPPATFESELNEPPVPTREVQQEPERFESVLARMVPPEARTAVDLAPPRQGGFRDVDLLQKVRPEPVAEQPVAEPADPTQPAAAAAADSALVLAPLAGHNPQPEYPAAARRHGIEGTTLLALTVDAGGNVTDVRLGATSGSRLLDEAAVRAARRWRFENGPGTVEVPFVFRLRMPRPD